MCKRILMTGATGFLGSHLLERLLRETPPPEITILKRSFSDTGRISHLLPQVTSFDLDRRPLEEVFDPGNFDIVLHCATNYGRGQVSRSQIVEPNLLLPLRLLDLAAGRGTRTFVNTDTMLDKNVSDYTLSKQQFREWLRRTDSGMTCINMLLEHFYGPGDDDTKFVTFLIGVLLEQRSEVLLTEGLQTRDFVYIDDVTEAFASVLRGADSQSGYLEYEVGSGRPTRLRDFVTLTRDLCGNTTTTLKFGALPYRFNEPMNVVADVARLEALGWRSRWALREGLERTIRAEKALGTGRSRRRPPMSFPFATETKGAACNI